MTLRLLTSRVTNQGFSQQFGDIIDVPDDEGARMVAAGQAAPVNEQIRQTAMIEQPRRGRPPLRASNRI